MKVKVMHEGKEIEVDLPKEYALQTELLSNDELFNEALEMRGIKLDKEKGSADNAELSELKKLILNQQKEVKAFKEIIENITKEKNDAQAEVKKYLESQRTKEISSIIEAAVKDGRITPENKEKWTERLKSNFDQFSEAINELPKSKALNNEGNNQKNNASGGMQKPQTGNKTLDAIMGYQQNPLISKPINFVEPQNN
jgi:predicted metal-dependent hydrolase